MLLFNTMYITSSEYNEYYKEDNNCTTINNYVGSVLINIGKAYGNALNIKCIYDMFDSKCDVCGECGKVGKVGRVGINL